MKLIIDIDDKVYNNLKNRGLTGMLTSKECECMNKSIYNGTPLPEKHGDLIDRSKLLVELECGIRASNYEEGYEKYPHINDMDDCYDTVKYADTIIKANY